MSFNLKESILGIATILLLISCNARASSTDGLAAHYSFDGDASDSSGNENNASVYGAQLTEDRFGEANSAYLFDGLDDYVEAPHSSSLDLTGPITLSAWIKSDGTYWVSSVITKMPDYEPAVGYTLCTIDSKAFGILSYSLDGSSHYSGWASSNTSVIDGEWHLLTATYDESEIRMYIDGQLESSEAYSDGYQSNSAPLKIGYRYYPYYDGREGSHNWALNGAIDDVRIYNRALSANEVQALYLVPEPAGPVAHWTFDNPADLGHDDASNGNNGTVNGANWTSDEKIGSGAALFDGIDDYIEVPNTNGVFDLIDAWTVALWVKSAGPFDTSRQFGYPFVWKTAAWRDYETFTLGWGDDWGDTRIMARIERASDDEDIKLLSATGYDTLAEWTHIVGMYDGQYLKLYINGVLDNIADVGSVASYTGPYPLRIGGVREIFFNGTLDDIYIYDRALSTTEVQQLLPEPADIEVSPLAHDFGDVELGTSRTTIVTISNVGVGNLTVTDINLSGDVNDFAITSGPNLPAIVEPNQTVDVQVTFTPTALGLLSADLGITSNDPCEPLVVVGLDGAGIEAPLTPSEQIAKILKFFDDSVRAGTIKGQGKCPKIANLRLTALRHIIKAAGELIEDQWYRVACCQLQRIYWRCDGKPWPPDFVEGPATAELAAMIEDLKMDLGCEYHQGLLDIE